MLLSGLIWPLLRFIVNNCNRQISIVKMKFADYKKKTEIKEEFTPTSKIVEKGWNPH